MSTSAEYERNTRRALDQMKQDRADHDRQSGRAVPSARTIEQWAAEIGRRNDRRASDNHGRVTRRSR